MTDASPPRVDEEANRLAALHAYAILDTPPEEPYDEVARLAARLCDTPIATVTFVDADRQWFKAKVGLDISQTPRGIAFCSVTLTESAPLVVEDARTDTRFLGNPLVTGPPHLVFYAGFPLLSADGRAVGTLAVMDRKPRKLNEQQRFAMQVLAHQVAGQLELRRSLKAQEQAHLALEQANRTLETRVQARTRELAEALAKQARSARLHTALWETTTDAVIILDSDSRILHANPSTTKVFGYRPQELIGQPVALLQPPEIQARCIAGFQRFLETSIRHQDWQAMETCGLHKDGRELPIEIALSEFSLEGQRQFVGFIRDISARKAAEASALAERGMAQAILRSIGDAVMACDEHDRVTFLNPLAERLTGWNHEEALGRMVQDILRLTDEVGDTPIDLHLTLGPATPDAPAGLPANALLNAKDGDRCSIEGAISPLVTKREGTQGWVMAFRDVSHARKLSAQMSFQASHDALTGLVNRSQFDHSLRQALSSVASEGREYSLLYLDLDQFKIVNDTCGHVAGDELLRQLAGLIADTVRERDVVGRLGGDEFGILLEDCGLDAAIRIAEKVRETVAEFSFAWESRMFPTSVSIGHVHFADHGMTLNEILSKADEACYFAKDHGRNRVHTYVPGDEVMARRHGDMEWVNLIRHALHEDRFLLYGQPIYGLANDPPEQNHCEILLRMRDRNGELVAPNAFIPAAERYDLMPKLDRWVVRSVLQLMARQGGFRDYAINLSGASVSDPGLIGFICDQLTAHAVAPSSVCFEITETAAIANLSGAVSLIHELKSLGCRFALDDFGSGMSSFAYLKRLPVDYLKIDGSFVRDILHDPVDRAMVEAINQLAHVMGLATTAECVEDPRIVRELRLIGVDYAQGFGLARPAPL